MHYYELKITLFLNQKIHHKNFNETFSKVINNAMLEDETLKLLHVKSEFKPYCIGSLFPFNGATKIHLANQVYILTIRSIDNNFLHLLAKSLKKSKNKICNILSTEIKIVKHNFIDSAYTLTPTIITLTDENNNISHWTQKNSPLNFVADRIKSNLEKKYLHFYGKTLRAPNDFIQSISLGNQVPIVINYKNTIFLANKFKLLFNNDSISQKLAFLAFGVGILEKNSLGFGFLTKGK